MADAAPFEFNAELKQHSLAEIAAMKAAAEKGDVHGQLEYGKALQYQLDHGDKSLTEAEIHVWYQKAADQGSGEAWFRIGYTTTNEALMRDAFGHAAELGFAPAFDYALDEFLFRAGEAADIDKAKRLVDLAREKNIEFYDKAEKSSTIDACYAAGKPNVTDAERAAITRDGRIEKSYTPNDSMKFAEAFANGWGVARDTRRAIAFDCHGNTVPAELIAQVEHLQERAKATAPAEPFLFCHELTSGMNGGFCTAFDEDVKQSKRVDKLAKLSASFTVEQKGAFGALQEAAKAYFDAHSGNEQDMSGTLRDAFFEDEEGRLRDEFLEVLDKFEHGSFPPSGNFARSDHSLNALYRQILVSTDWGATGTINADGVRTTERLWLKYRDAWATFGSLRYRDRSADDFRTWATEGRISQLKEAFNLGH